jgi:hypothetical protein
LDAKDLTQKSYREQHFEEEKNSKKDLAENIMNQSIFQRKLWKQKSREKVSGKSFGERTSMSGAFLH